ncbi:MAG: SAM-dependent methyltransferase [Clostridia bacterium]|nr:SAM-dependent methyltransferase [Clostridia bacterium]
MSDKLPLLSPRLSALADLVEPCTCIADIGTDHAYLPVYLCLTGKAEKGIASDIRKGPLARATDTLCRYHMENRIETRLGGGAETLSPKEADCIAIAGMGGLMIGEILAAHPDVFSTAKQILLQPMTALPELRSFLFEHGYTVLREILVPEENKLYHILSVTATPESEPLTEAECYFGRCLLIERPPYFDMYIQKQKRKLCRMAEGLRQASSEDAALRLKQVNDLLSFIQKEESQC